MRLFLLYFRLMLSVLSTAGVCLYTWNVFTDAFLTNTMAPRNVAMALVMMAVRVLVHVTNGDAHTDVA